MACTHDILQLIVKIHHVIYIVHMMAPPGRCCAPKQHKNLLRWCPRLCKMHKCNSQRVNSPRNGVGWWVPGKWLEHVLDWDPQHRGLQPKIHDLPHSKEEQCLVTNQQTLVLVLPVSEELLNQLFNDEEIASTVASWTLESGGKWLERSDPSHASKAWRGVYLLGVTIYCNKCEGSHFVNST